MIRALRQHLVLSLRLNFRSKQPLIYGYVVPVFFLLAFGSVFRSGTPPLLGQMGQLLTITVLGGACFGMPTAMVSERERGVWRRYRLLPASTSGLIVSAMVCRYVLVLSAAVVQIGLAWCFYRTPLPASPAQLAVAFTAVCFAFLGLGLIIAMLADTVPAVQALGQAIFLPMIMIGGVGVPLRNLPEWAQRVAGFFPGRYAVEALQACIAPEGGGLGEVKFALLALTLIGVAACVAGGRLFRWDGGQRARLDGPRVGWLLLALGTWVAVGGAAETLRHGAADRGTRNSGASDAPAIGVVAPKPAPKLVAAPAPVRAVVPAETPAASPAPATMAAGGWQSITDADLVGITYDELPPDDGYIVPLAKGFDQLSEDEKTRVNNFEDKLAYWAPGKGDDPAQRLRNLLSVCAVADLGQDPNEGEIAYAVFDEIQSDFAPDRLKQMLGWLILHPAEGTIRDKVDELGIDGATVDEQTRDRVVLYAKKLLLRVLGKPLPARVSAEPARP